MDMLRCVCVGVLVFSIEDAHGQSEVCVVCVYGQWKSVWVDRSVFVLVGVRILY